MKNYYKIGEISELYNIGPDSLRYYEELGILKPERGANKYRIYHLRDLWRLNVIRDLRELGFSMDRIKSYLNHRNLQATEDLLTEELDIIEEKMAKLEALRENIKDRLDTLGEIREQPMEVIEEKIFPPRHCYMIHSGYKIDVEMDMLIKQLLNKNPEKLYIIGNNKIGSVIPLESAKAGRCRDYKSVFIIDRSGEEVLEGGLYLTLCYKGDCEQNKEFFSKIEKYAGERGLELLGPVLELLWTDIHQTAEKEEHITEIQVLCRKKEDSNVI